ncbi:hypothetical protein [Methylobacterium oryzisoli]|uniref:hypothetical protein n=1 Tax=Methylobacterium oryzisoli TaxID=3385502 RepID=UPI003891A4C6
MARNLAAHGRVAKAAEEAERAAQEHTEKVEAAVAAVKARTESRLAKKGYGRTIADSALEQIAYRLKRELRGPDDT